MFMKYVELKNSLKTELFGVYVIFGDDRYLCFDALSKIEDAANISMKDLNMVTFSENYTADDVAHAANVYPFADQYRLVVAKDFDIQKKENLGELADFLKNPLSSTILVIFCPTKPEIFKAFNVTMVDCNKIDAKYISAFIQNRLSHEQISSSEEAIEKLILFCSNDMTRITSELEKLVAFAAESKIITADDIEALVFRDRDYQIYELAEFLAKGDAISALDLVDSILIKSGMAFKILTPLYNNYRRALFISINKDVSVSELAKLLDIKEYAVKMMKYQVSVFSAKKLKKIVDMIANTEKKIKMGELKEGVAIKMIIFNILNLRGNNG